MLNVVEADRYALVDHTRSTVTIIRLGSGKTKKVRECGAV